MKPIQQDPTELLLEAIAKERPQDANALRKLKSRVAAQSKTSLVRNDAVMTLYRQQVANGTRTKDPDLEGILRLNRIRSESGIATVTVITKPFPCPGRCVYCPTEARAPKSYLTNEPAVLRALRNDYDPYLQTFNRLLALQETGHPTDKIELIVKGGTWSFYDEAYQFWFVRRCLDAANAFALDSETANAVSEDDEFPKSSEHEFEQHVAAEQINETALARIIGITIETRPDYVDAEEIIRLRKQGVTRVEMGVQSLEDKVLDLMVRDHGTAETRDATALLKEAGLKVAYHLMPNLPGATPASDEASMKGLFDNPAYRPDTMKIYPCVVVESAELHEWFKDGRYETYDDNTLVELLIAMKQHAPPYLRIERVIRDIPSTSIEGGCQFTNLREEVHKRMRERDVKCQCVRCRQVRHDAPNDFELIERKFEASGGIEYFLSFESPSTDQLASLLRLRIPAAHIHKTPAPLPALEGAGLIRELHAYGQHLPLHKQATDAVQHKGYGSQLIERAEALMKEHGLKKSAIIAGVGVREYYKRFGYALDDTYMVKHLS